MTCWHFCQYSGSSVGPTMDRVYLAGYLTQAHEQVQEALLGVDPGGKGRAKWLLGVAGTPQEIASGRLFVVVTTGFPPNHAEMLVASAALVARTTTRHVDRQNGTLAPPIASSTV